MKHHVIKVSDWTWSLITPPCGADGKFHFTSYFSAKRHTYVNIFIPFCIKRLWGRWQTADHPLVANTCFKRFMTNWSYRCCWWEGQDLNLIYYTTKLYFFVRVSTKSATWIKYNFGKLSRSADDTELNWIKCCVGRKFTVYKTQDKRSYEILSVCLWLK